MRGPPPTAPGPRVRAPSARPRRRGALLATVLVAAAACAPGAPPRNALLVTLDTTRADAIGAFGAAPGLTPSIDRLAREGISWPVARTAVPLTLPAHASMLTGLYPPRHGVRTNGSRALPGEAETLAETARAAGIETAGFVAAPVLDRRSGIDQGFDTWSEPPLPRRSDWTPDYYGALSAREMTARAVDWLRGRPDQERPFFLWVHYFDPHTPWNAPRRFLERAGGNPYLAEVARVDAAVGELTAALEELGLLERTTIAVVGDHGEGLGEHGERTHGHFVYEGTLRVPFVLRPALGGPGDERRGSADDGPVSVVDVYPTLARALGLASEAGALDGIDLLAGPVPEARGVYFESYYGYLHLGWSPLAGWADARAKYVHSPVPELYLPQAWPDERVNHVHERTDEELAAYRARLAEVAARPRLEPTGDAAGSDLSAGLAALGYAEATLSEAGALPDPLEPSDLPSPHSRAGELELLDRARRLVLAGEHEKAVGMLREVLAANPLNAYALETLAEQLLQSLRPAEALPVYERLLELAGPSASIHAGMGRALERTGRLEEAIEHYRRAVELVPYDVDTLRLLAAGLERTGATEEAARRRDQLQRELGY